MERQFNQKDAEPLNNCVGTIESMKVETMYKHIFNVSIDGLVLWDNQHRIIDANPAAELLWNSPPGEANREAI